MAVGLALEFQNLTLDDYDKVCEALNFPSDWPDGLLAHGSTEIDGRLVVWDFWESRAKFDEFVQSRLGAAIGEALGDRAEEPQVRESELHSFHTR
jgi:hypothetical protein